MYKNQEPENQVVQTLKEMALCVRLVYKAASNTVERIQNSEAVSTLFQIGYNSQGLTALLEPRPLTPLGNSDYLTQDDKAYIPDVAYQKHNKKGRHGDNDRPRANSNKKKKKKLREERSKKYRKKTTKTKTQRNNVW